MVILLSVIVGALVLLPNEKWFSYRKRHNTICILRGKEGTGEEGQEFVVALGSFVWSLVTAGFYVNSSPYNFKIGKYKEVKVIAITKRFYIQIDL